jgi:hypothetical protein
VPQTAFGLALDRLRNAVANTESWRDSTRSIAPRIRSSTVRSISSRSRAASPLT